MLIAFTLHKCSGTISVVLFYSVANTVSQKEWANQLVLKTCVFSCNAFWWYCSLKPFWCVTLCAEEEGWLCSCCVLTVIHHPTRRWRKPADLWLVSVASKNLHKANLIWITKVNTVLLVSCWLEIGFSSTAVLMMAQILRTALSSRCWDQPHLSRAKQDDFSAP